MTIAAKHMDPILGVDVHIVMIPSPAGPIPTPLPNPYVGMVLDPFDYIPFIGATVYINGLPRAQAGTGGIALVPHLPLGGPLAPPPTNESEVFMGSSTVAVDGDAQSHLGLPVLSCQSIGAPPPPRMKGAPPKSLVLPTSVVLSIPMGPPVLIGGPPTISLMALGFRAGFASLAKLGPMIRRAQRGAGRIGDAMRAATARARRAGDALAETLGLGATARNRINRAICTVTGHPVDVATGKVITDKVDFELPGPIPFVWERVWYSTNTYRGPLGIGWHHRYDAALYAKKDVVLYRTPDGRVVSLPPLSEGQEYFDQRERLTLLRDASGYTIRKNDQLSHRFIDIARPNDEHVLSSVSDRLGNTMRFTYDDHGHLARIVDVAGRSFEFLHDSAGRITNVTARPDPAGEGLVVVRYLYDEQGHLTGVIDTLGAPASYRYDKDLLVKETDRNGLSFYFEYDGKTEHSRCIRTWGDGGVYDRRLDYDDDQGTTDVIDSLGNSARYTHRDGVVVKTVDAIGAVTTTQYDDAIQVVAETDALGHRTEFEYDAHGNVVERKTADGAAVRCSYDLNAQPISAVDAIGGTWTWKYDEYGRLIESTNPMNETTAIEWRDRHTMVVVDALGNRTSAQYDASGNLLRVIGPDGAGSSWSYDEFGRLRSKADANANEWSHERDAAGRVIRTCEADGNIREFAYNPEGRVTHARDRHTHITFTYQGMGRIASRTEAGTTVSFEYDTEERLTAIRNEHGAVYRFVLDRLGNVAEEHGFDGLRRAYRHDKAGRVSEVFRPGGRQTTYRRDALGRVTDVVQADGTMESYAYRADGHVLRAMNDTVTIVFERDPVGRIVKESQGLDWVTSTYDALGRRSAFRSSKGAFQRIRRNAWGDVLGLEAESGEFIASFTRDRMGNEIDRSLPGGIRSQWARDQLGRPVRQEVFSGPAFVGAKQLTWGVDNRLERVVDAMHGPVDYARDALGSLAAATYLDGGVQLRMPDAVGNLFRSEHRMDRRYGPAGQLLEAQGPGGLTRYEYDPEGNLTRKRDPDGGVWLYLWNHSGMLTRVIRPDGHAVEFAYDALGRRVMKKYRAKITRWVWDRNVPLHEWIERVSGDGDSSRAREPAQIDTAREVAQRSREASLMPQPAQGPPDRAAEQEPDERLQGTFARPITWLFEPEGFAPFGKLANGENFAIVGDHLGAPTHMFDGAGREVWSAELDSYGKTHALRGAASSCPFRWPGQYEDTETGLYYNRFRYYDPDAGQYTSQDRVGLVGGTALYAYARDPLRECDVTGLAPSPMLPGEGDVGSYGDLRRAGSSGDNLTPHHMPADRYMAQSVPGYTRNEGISMNMEQPTPGAGGRHRRTASYGSPPDLSLTPRQALARDIWDARRIYMQDGLYDSRMRQALLDVIAQNRARWPHAFERPGGTCP